MNTREHLYVVILAGGSGTRLWPRSRRDRPKQLLDLITARTMLQETVDRILPLARPAHILVVTGAGHAALVRDQLPDLPLENIITEPAGRNTGPAIGLAALHLNRRDPDAVMISLHSDHHVRDAAAFCEALAAAGDLARRDYLVTLGIQPTHPETGYGYVQRDEPIDGLDRAQAYRVARFTEKPKLELASEMVARGDYYWNAGIFAWRVVTLLAAFARYHPVMYDRLMALDAALDGDAALFGPIWETIPREPIDTAIMEKAERVAVIPVDVGWSDVGSWRALHELAQADETGNVLIGEHICVDTTGSYIYSPGKLVAAIGVSDLVVVDTGDALLICPQDRAQEVKDIVDELKRQKKDHYL